MKRDLLWAKTLLSVYRYLERICGSIDKIISRTALSSVNVNKQTFYYNNVYSITQRIIDLSDRKVTLINLKLLIESVLQKMRSEEANTLICRYFDGRKIAALADQKQVSVRTIFRKLERAEESFAKLLLAKGYNDIELQKILKHESWIRGVFDRFLQKENEEFVFSNCYLERVASI